MSILDKQTPSQLSQGINKGLNFQNPNQVTFALNTIRDSHDGGKPEYQSEPGNELVESLDFGYSLIGHIYGINNEVYLFGVRNEVDNIIGIFREGKFTKIVEMQGLDFSVEYPISGEFRIRNGCERVIYWCDGNSDDKWFNFDDINAFKSAGVYDPNKFKFNPTIMVPKMDLLSVNNYGGNTELGSYYFQLELLDINENIIYKTDISPQTVLYDESQNDDYYNIDGGLNVPQYDTSIGGVPITNKSISLRFYNIDTNFAYLRVNVARQIAGTQAIDAHSIGNLIPITDIEIEWTYRGFNPNLGDFPIDYTSMLINSAIYESSLVMEQVQNRLLRANLQQGIRDYSEYQYYATKIIAEWTTDIITDAENASVIGSPKHPNTYWEKTSFQSDEIYLFGIRYLHDTGDWSPVFPLVGRRSNSDDTELLTVVSNATSPLGATEVWESDVEHLPEEKFDVWNGAYIGSEIQRWKVFNTAVIDGTFGYYETDATYPDIQTCDGEYIWGVDSEDIEVTPDDKIRLFRFPDRKMFPHYAESGGQVLLINYGVKFDNIEYPNANVVGHQFCFAEREGLNRTVVDTGWIAEPHFAGGGFDRIQLTRFFNNDDGSTPYAEFISSDILFNQNLNNADYLGIYNAYRGETESVNLADFEAYPTSIGSDNGTLQCHIFKLRYSNHIDAEITNRKVEKTIFSEPRTLTDSPAFPEKVANFCGLGSSSVIELTTGLPELTSTLGAPVFNTHPTDPVSFELNMYYGAKKVLNNPFESIIGLSYKRINFNYTDSVLAADNIYYNGDILITSSCMLREARVFYDTNPADQVWECISYPMFYEEKEINSQLRHSGLEPQFTYFKLNDNSDHFIYKVSELNSAGRYELFPRETVIDTTFQIEKVLPEYYAYNKDYVLQKNEMYKTTLPFNFDYCTECQGRYTNRIIFSPKSFDEELFDLYRTNLTNDYIDIPGHRGAITGLKYYNNQLIVHCEDGTFILQPNPRALATSEESVYLTTGDFLSIPPNELVQTDIGYAGCQHKQHQVDTPNGHCWIDQRRGEIFLYSGQLKVLSNIGNMTQWFKENLPSETNNAVYQAYEIDYPHTATMPIKGRGIIMYYDPRFKRLIISKKDYLPINLRERIPEVIGDLFYSQVQDAWLGYTNQVVTVIYGNSTNFENKSWTLSFGFEYDQWISWHTYRPVYAFSDEMHYYTSSFLELANNQIWRHKDKQNYQKYYGIKYDMIIEWMNFDIDTDNFYGVNYTGYSLEWDSTTRQWKPVEATFNKGIFYNFDQSSGLVTLTLQDQHTNPYQNNVLPVATKYVIKTDQNYKISGIYDIATASPVMTNDWTTLKTYNGYIDLMPYTANLDSTQSNYYMGNIWDKFVLNRLYYKPTQDYKKVIILSSTKEHKSIR